MIWYLILIQLSVNENTAASEVVSPELAIVLLILQMVGMRGALLPVTVIYQLPTPTRIEMVRHYYHHATYVLYTAWFRSDSFSANHHISCSLASRMNLSGTPGSGTSTNPVVGSTR